MERRDGARVFRALTRLPARLRAAVPARLAVWRRLALAVLWAEYALRLLWLPTIFVCACLAVALLGLVPEGVLGPLVMVGLTLAGFVWPLLRGWRALRRPDATDAERRLEHDSGLRHHPFAVLRDQPAEGTGAASFWRAHRAAAAASLARLRLRGPGAELAIHDPFAARAAALLLLAAGFVVAGPQAGPRLLAAFVPGFAASGTAAPVLQAWLEPPAYTGMPPIFLPAAGGAAQVPDGSKLTVSLTGGRFAPHLSLDGARIKLHDLGGASWQGHTILHHGGALRLTRLFSDVARWNIELLTNDPPEANWAGPPSQAGHTLETRFPWHVAQRWGVASLQLELRPDSDTDLPPIVLPVPLPGTPKDASGQLQTDLSANPYAGVKMRAVLMARDVSGQTGASAPAFINLPQRPFKNALARAIIELRRRLALRQETAEEAAADLEALSPAPKTFEGHAGIWLNTEAVVALLRQSRSLSVLPEAEARLWILALDLDGALPQDSERALQRAREDARKALSDRAEGKITDQELALQLEKLREALQQRMADMARQAAKDGKLQGFDPRGQHFQMPSLERALRDIEKEAREGHADEARRRMSQLEKMLEKMPQARVLTPQQAREAQEAMKEQRKREDAVKDMVQREAGLMDNAQTRAPRPAPERRRPHLQFPPGAFGQFGQIPMPQFGEQAAPPPPDADQLEATEESREADAKTQRALRQALTALQQMIGPQAPAKFNDAKKAMGEANEALIAGQEQPARAAEARAIEALSQGGKQMRQQAEANAQMVIIPGGAPGDEQAGEEPGSDGDGGPTDPLGRPLQQGTGGKASDDNSVKVPDEMEAGRSRAIQEELRKRGAERARPKQELDYIDRLLKPF
jgi:uncharacterized protein (TIGR02302 family)